MDLQNFIKQTLVSIKQGVAAANREIIGDKEKVKAPYAVYSRGEGEIIFDVAVTVSAATKKNKEGILKVAVAQLGGEKHDQTAEETISRIKFAVKVDSTIR